MPVNRNAPQTDLRLVSGADFNWPLAPGVDGKPVDMSIIPENPHFLDHATTLMDPTYPERFRQAMQQGVRTLEDHCVKLAYEGVKRMVTYKGKPVKVNGEILYEVEFHSQALMFLLKSYDRKRFGDKIDTTFGPNWSGNLEDLPEEFLRQVLQQIEAQGAALKAKELEQAQTIDIKAEMSAEEFPKKGE